MKYKKRGGSNLPNQYVPSTDSSQVPIISHQNIDPTRNSLTDKGNLYEKHLARDQDSNHNRLGHQSQNYWDSWSGKVNLLDDRPAYKKYSTTSDAVRYHDYDQYDDSSDYNKLYKDTIDILNAPDDAFGTCVRSGNTRNCRGRKRRKFEFLERVRKSLEENKPLSREDRELYMKYTGINLEEVSDSLKKMISLAIVSAISGFVYLTPQGWRYAHHLGHMVERQFKS